MPAKPFIYMNGWPGVGKTTVAKGLVTDLGPEVLVVSRKPTLVLNPLLSVMRQLYNHLQTDLSDAVLPRSSVGHHEVRRRHRRATFQSLEEELESYGYMYDFHQASRRAIPYTEARQSES